MAKRRTKANEATTGTDEQPALIQDAAAEEAVSQSADSTVSTEPDTSGGDEPTSPEAVSESASQPVSSAAVSHEPLAAGEETANVQPPAASRPLMTDVVTVRCVVAQAILDGRFMVQGEGRQVAYGVYRQAWQRNAAAFVVKYPGAGGFVQETT